jgi:hypothetical protein
LLAPDGYTRLRGELGGLRTRYLAANPFPHIVMDDVLPPSVFAKAVREFPVIDDPSWIGYLHLNEKKFANPWPATWGSTLVEIASSLLSDEFVGLLGELTGFDGLIADTAMDGGGLHQTLRGGYLNVHTDFTTNHRVRDWRRRVNVLLYLNETWSADWGGALELWDSSVSRCVRSIEPVGNRLVIFTTSDDAFHGHPDPLQCPTGTARRSLALYYFTEERDSRRRATNYRPRPGDGLKRFVIGMDRQALRLYDLAKTRFGLTDRAANGALRRVNEAVHRGRPSDDLPDSDQSG